MADPKVGQGDSSTVDKASKVAGAFLPYLALAATLLTQFKQLGLGLTVGGLVGGAVAAVFVFVAIRRGWRVAALITIVALLLVAAFLVGRWTIGDAESNVMTPGAHRGTSLELNATILSYTPQGSPSAISLNPPPGGKSSRRNV